MKIKDLGLDYLLKRSQIKNVKSISLSNANDKQQVQIKCFFPYFYNIIVKMPYDTVCLNDTCIKNRNAFFEYDPDSEHIANKHNVKYIHPSAFAAYFPKDAQQNSIPLLLNGESIWATLEKIRNNSFLAAVEAVRTVFYDSKLFQDIEKQLFLSREINTKTILARLNSQDYTILQHLKRFETGNKQKNFKDYLVDSVSLKSQQLKKKFTQLKDVIIGICMSIQGPKNCQSQQRMIQQPKFDVNSLKQEQRLQFQHTNSNQLQVNNPKTSQLQRGKLTLDVSMRPNHILGNIEVIVNARLPNLVQNLQPKHNQDKEDEEQEQEQDQQIQHQQKNENKIEKHKIIIKQHFSNLNLEKQKKRRKNFNATDGIEILNQNEIIINQVRLPLKTIAFLKQKFPFITTLHIFHQTMAKEAIIMQLLQTFPKIYRITLNCFNDFEPKNFNSVSNNIRNRLTIEPKWDISTFFDEYQANKHFPFKAAKKIQRTKQINIQEFHDLFPNNNSVWDWNYNSRQWLQRNFYGKQRSITSLRLNFNISRIIPFKNIDKYKHVQTLVLQNITIESKSSFIRFIAQSQHLHTFVIIECKFLKITLNQILISAEKLTNLSKLSISQSNQIYNIIKPQLLFKLTNLTHLNLQSHAFENPKKQQQFFNMKDLSNLPKLQHLSLYNCWNYNQESPKEDKELAHINSLLNNDNLFEKFRTKVLSYLSLASLKSLAYLNLGRTIIGNGACDYLTKMDSLKYLNIDFTRIQGQFLIKALKFMTSKHTIYGIPLKQLSIQRKPDKVSFTVQHLKEMAKYLLNLSYINVAGNSKIQDYNFADFKKLKTIALSEVQFTLLNPLISPDIDKFTIK